MPQQLRKYPAARAVMALALAAGVWSASHISATWAQKAEQPTAEKAADIDPARLAAAREIFAAQGGRAQAQELLDKTSESILEETKQSSPEMAEPLERFLKKYFDPTNPKIQKLFDDVLDASARFYAQRFTVEELTALANFLKSPTGQKFVKAAPAASAAAAPPILDFQRRLMFELQYAFARGEFKSKKEGDAEAEKKAKE